LHDRRKIRVPADITFSPDDLIKLDGALAAQPQFSIIAPDGSRTIWNESGSMRSFAPAHCYR
jgi:hypothetical protein